MIRRLPKYGAILCLTLLTACDSAVGSVANCVAQPNTSDLSIGGSLQLVVCTRDGPYDARHIPVFVGVRNATDRPQVIRSSLDVYGRLGVWVLDPDGRELQPHSTWEPPDIAPEALPLARSRLPRGGIAGRIIDLACDMTEFGVGACQELYRFGEAGLYTIRVENEGALWCPAPCRDTEEGFAEELPVRFRPITVRIEVR